MMRTIGVPCGILAQLVLDSVLDMCHVHVGDMCADTGVAGGGGFGVVERMLCARGVLSWFSCIEDGDWLL